MGQGTMSAFSYKVSIIQLEQAQARDRVYWNNIVVAYRDKRKTRFPMAYVFLGSKIAADGDCSHEIKRCLLLRRKVMTKLDSILKSRDITLLAKVRLVKAMVFPVVMYGCESWIIRKAERQRIDAFELRCWR